MRKKTLYICVAVVVLLGVIFMLNYIKNAPFRWSRSVCEAIRQENTETALQLIEEGVRKGYSMDTLSESPSRIWTFLEQTPQTPLQAACMYGNYPVAQQLFANGASAKAQKDGSTRESVFCVLCRAYKPTDAALIQLLIDHGAVFNDRQFGDAMMVQAAFRSPYIPGTDADSSPESQIYSAETAEGIADVFLLLSEYGNCYATNGAGQNPLHCAVMMENWHLVSILIEKFDYALDAQDIHGKTAYDLAVESGAEEEILSRLMPK